MESLVSSAQMCESGWHGIHLATFCAHSIENLDCLFNLQHHKIQIACMSPCSFLSTKARFSSLVVVDKAIQEDSIGHLRWAKPARSHQIIQFKARVHSTSFGIALQRQKNTFKKGHLGPKSKESLTPFGVELWVVIFFWKEITFLKSSKMSCKADHSQFASSACLGQCVVCDNICDSSSFDHLVQELSGLGCIDTC